MGTKVVITLKDPRAVETVRGKFKGATRRIVCSKAADYFDNMAAGMNRAAMEIEFSEEAMGDAKPLEPSMPPKEEEVVEPKKKTRKKKVSV